PRSPPGRNNPPNYTPLAPPVRIDDGHLDALGQSDRYPALLSIVLAVIPAFPGRPVKHQTGIGEAHPVIPDVAAILGGIPIEAHWLNLHNVDTWRQYGMAAAPARGKPLSSSTLTNRSTALGRPVVHRRP